MNTSKFIFARRLRIADEEALVSGEGNGNPLQCSCLENPRDGVPGGLLSLGSQRVRHD